ncbi:MAG: class I SAM-dependent methyltransferase, partial [Ignavibacteriaceae bacterium]
GLNGHILKGNAESLELPSEYFDIVYSHGVLHHTENINKTFNEIYRVLKPGGKFIVMLYAKESFNYWIRIQLYFRTRVLVEWMKNKIGIINKGIWAEHIKNLNERGFNYLGWNEFPHHCTDGPNCEIADIFSKKEISKRLINVGFKVEKKIKAHFPIGGKFPELERKIAKYIGFHRIIWCTKN